MNQESVQHIRPHPRDGAADGAGGAASSADVGDSRAAEVVVAATPADDIEEALRTLARPRMAGSAGAAAAAAEVQRRLAAIGYDTRVVPFVFSAIPGRFAVSIAAGAFGAFVLAGTLLLIGGVADYALGFFGAGALLTGVVALLARPAMRYLAWGRVTGRNIIAQARGRRPRYVVMAHLDTKSQLVPLGLRAPAIMLGVGGWIALVLLGIASLAQPVPTSLVLLAGVVTLTAVVPLLLSWAENESDGALDNASGLAALLALAVHEREHGDIAFLVTDGEELGLAGARAIASELPPVFGVLNLDGLDDDGAFHVIERFGWPRRGLAPHMAAALLHAAAEQDAPIHRRDLPFGLLVDHMAIVQAGQPALTLMRGTLRSLQRVHQRSDTLARLRGSGVHATVRLVAAALDVLRRQEETRRGGPATTGRSGRAP